MDFKMAAAYFNALNFTIEFLDPLNVGIGASNMSISVLVKEIFNKTGTQWRPF